MLLICGEIDLSAGQRLRVLRLDLLFREPQLGPSDLARRDRRPARRGSLVGLVNGVITVVVGVPSFITTLGMIFLLNGLTLHHVGCVSRGDPGRPHVLQDLRRLAAYATVYWALGVIIVMTILLNRTRWGLHTIATGGNLIGASESGVNVRGSRSATSCSQHCSPASPASSTRRGSPPSGRCRAARTSCSSPSPAAVIGGTSLFGGSGTDHRRALGVAVLAVLNLGFTHQGVSAFTFDLIIGVAIIASMIVQRALERIRHRDPREAA